MADLKRIYAAVDKQAAISDLNNFEEWNLKYHKIIIY